MILETDLIKAKGRFAVLLAREAFDRKPYDQPLLETRDWIVAPTLGAIVPNWLIVVPREPVLNFRIWYARTAIDPTAIVSKIGEHLSLAANRILWFEHGPKIAGSELGCGVDHAHLHLILDPSFSFESFMEQVEKTAMLDWVRSTRDEAYRQLTGQASYLVIGSGDRVAIAQDVERTGSQFLRKMVARMVGQADMWNYRYHPRYENISRTIQTFRALEHVSRHGN